MSQSPSSGGWPDPQSPPAGGWPDPPPPPPPPAAGGWADPPAPAPGSWADPDTVAAPAATPAVAGAPLPPTQPLYPGASYGAPATGPPGYGYASYGYGYAPPPKTNGMAVASMVVSIVAAVGLCAYGLGGLIGVVGALLGHVARRQVRAREEGGDGMALAGIIVGWIAFGIGVLALIAIVAFIIFAVNSGA